MSRDLFIHLHVPKCAGSTVEAYFARQLDPAGFWAPPKRTRKLPLELLGRKYHAALPGAVTDVTAISGHFIGQSIERLFPDRRIRRSILLREPTALLLSWYNFRMMRYLSAGQQAYPFATHLKSMPPDPVAHFLLERWFEIPVPQLALMSLSRKREMLDTMLAGCDFIGDISACDALIARLSSDLGASGDTTKKNSSAEWRDRTGWTLVTSDDLSASDRALIDRRTGLDSYLWMRWAQGKKTDPSAIRTTSFASAAPVQMVNEVRRRAQRR